MTSLVFGERTVHSLRDALLEYAPDEAAAILICGVVDHDGDMRLLVRDFTIFSRSDYLEQTIDRVIVKPEAIVPHLKRARAEQLGVVLAHTHPAVDVPELSIIDDAGERAILPVFFSRAERGPHGTTVLGKSGFDGRIYTDPITSLPLERYKQAGSVTITLPRRHSGENRPTLERNDRSIRALGAAGQQRLAETRVAVIGAGGTGSIVAEQMAYLGVQSLLVVDFDTVDITNLNRMVGALPRDIGRPKAEVLADRIRAISPSTETRAVIGDIASESVARQILEYDFVFSCTDSHGSRAIINQVCYQYYLPTIDLGLRIDTSPDGAITSMAGRVQMLAPGLPCLVCEDLLDPEQVRRDLLTPEQRQEDRYIVGSPQPQPAVITLNGVVASLAATMFLSAAAGLAGPARHQVYRIEQGVVRSVNGKRRPDCVICSLHGALGRGDRWSPPWRPG